MFDSILINFIDQKVFDLNMHEMQQCNFMKSEEEMYGAKSLSSKDHNQKKESQTK